MTLAPGAVFGAGKWVIERELSSGGMGAVYVAKHRETGRPVALKVIKADATSAELISRFAKETNALASISHPNVVTFLDSGVEDGTLYLVMELLKGRPLRAIMSAPVAPQRAMRVCADVCRALVAVHELNTVHRDLKPENVFLVDAAGHDEYAKLIDFGIARLEDASTRATATKTGAVMGTPGYISPEQLQGQPATVASDVYAIGVILYELVTGQFPFAAPTTHAMLVKQLFEPLPPPRSVLSTIPEQVERVILRFMERDPRARTQTAAEALAILVDALAGRAVLAGDGARHALTGDSARPAAAAQGHATSLPPGAATEMGAPPAADVASKVVRAFEEPSPSRPTAPTPRAPIIAPPPAAVSPQRAAALRESQKGGLKLLAALGIGGVVFMVTAVVCGIAVEGARRKSERDTPAGVAAGAAPAAVGVAGFVGDWQAHYSGTYVVRGIPGEQTNSAEASISVVKGKHAKGKHAKGKHPPDLQMTWTAAGGAKGSCLTTLDFDEDDLTASFAPAQQSCTFTWADGSAHTNTFSAEAQLVGASTMIIEVGGTLHGKTPRGEAYMGAFEGVWTLTR